MVPRQDIEQPSLPVIQKGLPGIWGVKHWDSQWQLLLQKPLSSGTAGSHSQGQRRSYVAKSKQFPGIAPLWAPSGSSRHCQRRFNCFELLAFLISHWESALREKDVKSSCYIEQQQERKKKGHFSPENWRRLAIRANYIQLLNLMDLWFLVILGQNYRDAV